MSYGFLPKLIMESFMYWKLRSYIFGITPLTNWIQEVSHVYLFDISPNIKDIGVLICLQGKFT